MLLCVLLPQDNEAKTEQDKEKEETGTATEREKFSTQIHEFPALAISLKEGSGDVHQVGGVDEDRGLQPGSRVGVGQRAKPQGSVWQSWPKWYATITVPCSCWPRSASEAASHNATVQLCSPSMECWLREGVRQDGWEPVGSQLGA